MPSILDNASIQRVAVIKQGKSPNPPPRQRHNPFNKTIYEGGVQYHHQRSQSLRSAPETPHR